MGDLADDDRHHGMGIVVEYAGRERQAAVGPSKTVPLELRSLWPHHAAPEPDQILEMTFAKQNAAQDGFNLLDNQRCRLFRGRRCKPMFRVKQRQALPPAHAECE